MDGIERLEQEALAMNNHNVILIFDYIKNKEELQDKFNNKEKTIKGMYDFICNKARILAVRNVSMVNDNIVYIWAMAYFNKSNEELGINNNIIVQENVAKKIEPKNQEEKDTKREKSDNQISLFEEVHK